MPHYNTAAAACALGVSPKWLDNLLSHNKIDGVWQARQGVARRVSPQAMEVIALARDLNEGAKLPIAAALDLARAVLRSPDASILIGPFLQLQVNRAPLRSSMAERLASAVEVMPHPARGRPRRTTTPSL